MSCSGRSALHGVNPNFKKSRSKQHFIYGAINLEKKLKFSQNTQYLKKQTLEKLE